MRNTIYSTECTFWQLKEQDANGIARFGEVLYYFQATDTSVSADLRETRTQVMISLASPVDLETLQSTSNALWIVQHGDNSIVRVFDIKSIESVVAFLPVDKEQKTFSILEELGVDMSAASRLLSEPDDKGDI